MVAHFDLITHFAGELSFFHTQHNCRYLCDLMMWFFGMVENGVFKYGMKLLFLFYLSGMFVGN